MPHIVMTAAYIESFYIILNYVKNQMIMDFASTLPAPDINDEDNYSDLL